MGAKLLRTFLAGVGLTISAVVLTRLISPRAADAIPVTTEPLKSAAQSDSFDEIVSANLGKNVWNVRGSLLTLSNVRAETAGSDYVRFIYDVGAERHDVYIPRRSIVAFEAYQLGSNQGGTISQNRAVLYVH